MATPSKEGGGTERIVTPVGLRMLWSIGVLLGTGTVFCLLGLVLTDPTDHGWAIGAYITGLVFATVGAFALSGLATRRRRILFEAESAAAELQRLQARFGYEDLDRGGLKLRLVFQMGTAVAYREALLGAEAYGQTLELDRALAEAEDVLAGLEERR
jgi:hypothetical protein